MTFTHFSCLKVIIPSFQVICFLFSHGPVSLLSPRFQVSHLFFGVVGGILLITTLKWVLERKESDLKLPFLGRRVFHFTCPSRACPLPPAPPIQALSLTLAVLLAPTLLISDAAIIRTRPASLEEVPGSSRGLCKVPALRLRDHPTKGIFLNDLNPGKTPLLCNQMACSQHSAEPWSCHPSPPLTDLFPHQSQQSAGHIVNVQ